MGEEDPANFYNYYHDMESHEKRMEFHWKGTEDYNIKGKNEGICIR
jgi:hypothetical protein